MVRQAFALWDACILLFRRGFWAMALVTLTGAWTVTAWASDVELPQYHSYDPSQVSIQPSSDGKQLTIEQTAPRSVIEWNRFNIIGEGAKVYFDHQSGQNAATLNIVVGENSPSILAGELEAVGSVYLINPYGITVTDTGKVNTGGAFVASTLRAVTTAEEFLSGNSNQLKFEAHPTAQGKVKVEEHGSIRARDVVLLANQVENAGTITADYGRVALGSAPQAALDFDTWHPDGFLQLCPDEDVTQCGDTSDTLVVNSGKIFAKGGLVELKAATVYSDPYVKPWREAINMPGEIHARSVSGHEGKVVFSAGGGGTIVVDGTVNASPLEGEEGASGGQIEISGAKVDLDFSNVSLGADGRFALTAHGIKIARGVDVNPDEQDATWIVEERDYFNNTGKSEIGDLLRAGVHVTLHGNESLTWSGGLEIKEGQVGNLRLLAGREISLDGWFTTGGGDWTLLANVKPAWEIELDPDGARAILSLSEAVFLNTNGHLTLKILGGADSAGLNAAGIDLPWSYHGRALTAEIDREAGGYDSADIVVYGDIDVAETLWLSGHLRTAGEAAASGPGLTLKGREVIWATEETDTFRMGVIRFVEKRGDEEVVTRFGVVHKGPSIRLALGSGQAYVRMYGDSNPGQEELGQRIFTVLSDLSELLSPEDDVSLEELLKLDKILKPGSIIVEGPDPRAGVGSAYLRLRVDADQLGFAGDMGYDGPGYWIDLTGLDENGPRVPLIIEPRPITVEILFPVLSQGSYDYGAPQPLVRFKNVLEGDDVYPVGQLISGTSVTDVAYVGFGANGDGAGPDGYIYFGLDRTTGAGNYEYQVTGIGGNDSANYEFPLPVGL